MQAGQKINNRLEIKKRKTKDPEEIHINQVSDVGFKITGIIKFKNLNDKMKKSNKEVKLF